MKYKNIFGLTFLFFLVLFLYPVKADTYISSCSVLNTAGETYYLTADISSPADCIIIQADNITLNCQGHTISSMPCNCSYFTDIDSCFRAGCMWDNDQCIGYCWFPYTRVGIDNYDHKNVSIYNCNLVGPFGDRAILFFYADNSNIINNTIINGTLHLDMNSNNSNIINNTVINDGYALIVGSSKNNTISGNKITGTLFLDGGAGGYSTNNKIYNNIFNGSFIISTSYINYWNTTRQTGTRIYSQGTEIGGNYWTNPSGSGYSDTCTDSNKDGFCDDPYTLSTNNVDYLPLSDEYKPHITTCSVLNQSGETYYLDNDITNSASSICIDIQADNVTLDCQGHIIDGTDNSGTIGIRIQSHSSNTIRNCVITDWHYGIYIGSSYNNTIVNSTSNSNVHSGIYLYTSNGNNIINSTLSENTIYDLYISTDSDYDCNNYLENVIGSNNLPIKYYNYSVNLSNEILSELILCNADNSNITNITIDASKDLKNNGIFVIRTEYSNLNKINSSDNYIGIQITLSSNNTISNSISNGNGYSGISLTSSSNNTIIGSTLNNNSYYGIYASPNVNYNKIINSIANNNTVGIYISAGNNNTITNCTANYNSYYGIQISTSSSNNTITNCTANYNLNYGYLIYQNSNYNTISNSIVISNSHTGIYIHTSSNNVIYNNKIQDNLQYGIRLNSASGNLIYNNLLNNTNNIYFLGTIYDNYFNTTRQAGTRIYSLGTEIGGNYWTNSTGNGYSDICNDTDTDGFCDDPYTLATDNVDYLPLSNKYMPPPAPRYHAPFILQVSLPMVIAISILLLATKEIIEFVIGKPDINKIIAVIITSIIAIGLFVVLNAYL